MQKYLKSSIQRLSTVNHSNADVLDTETLLSSYLIKRRKRTILCHNPNRDRMLAEIKQFSLVSDGIFKIKDEASHLFLILSWRRDGWLKRHMQQPLRY